MEENMYFKKLKFSTNEKGQAFSTFELLIAAIVALAILGILLSIVGGINIFGRNPQDTTVELVKTQMNNNLGGTAYTDTVKFKTNDSLSVYGIAQSADLDPNQIYIVVPDALLSDFNYGQEFKTITYKKSTAGTFQIGVFCYIGSELSTPATGTDFESLVSKLSIPTDYSDSVICVISPKRAA
jgi:hypothetical protein